MTKTEQALRLIATEGITAKEAAKRVGISGAAISKGRHHPSRIATLEREIERLKAAPCRCPSCNHEFPHHWSGCSDIASVKGGAA